MTDFSKILEKAKEVEAKMKESQEKIKQIEVIGVSGGDAVKVTLNGEGEMVNLELSDEVIKEDKGIIVEYKKSFQLNSFQKWLPFKNAPDVKVILASAEPLAAF